MLLGARQPFDTRSLWQYHRSTKGNSTKPDGRRGENWTKKRTGKEANPGVGKNFMNSNTHHGAVINQAMTTRVSVFSVRGAVASAAATFGKERCLHRFEVGIMFISSLHYCAPDNITTGFHGASVNKYGPINPPTTPLRWLLSLCLLSSLWHGKHRSHFLRAALCALLIF